MRTLRVLGGMVALLAMTAGTAHADSVQTSGTCDGLSVTAPAGSRVIVGLDASPPYEVGGGNTGTFKFFQYVDHHTWAVTVLVDGVTVDHADGVVDGCVAIPLPVATLPDPVSAPAVVTPEPTQPIEAATTIAQVSAWVGVELAPPW